jgi:hypothetical protein
VTVLTILSVLWADRIVATSSSSGEEWSSAHFASGYAFRRRRKTTDERCFFSSKVSLGARGTRGF